MRETRQLHKQLVSLLLSHKGKNELIGQFAVGRERKKREEWEGKYQAAGESAERDLKLVKLKMLERGKYKGDDGKEDRRGGDAQHVDDRKSYSFAERTRGADRDLNKQQFIPLVFWYIV